MIFNKTRPILKEIKYVWVFIISIGFGERMVKVHSTETISKANRGEISLINGNDSFDLRDLIPDINELDVNHEKNNFQSLRSKSK